MKKMKKINLTIDVIIHTIDSLARYLVRP